MSIMHAERRRRPGEANVECLATLLQPARRHRRFNDNLDIQAQVQFGGEWIAQIGNRYWQP